MSDETAYEMLWDCRYCGSKKLLGVTHRHCPSCGAPQATDARYFPADEDRVLAKDHRFAGADVSCPHCQEANGRAAVHCRSCGGPLAGAAEVKRRDDVVHDPAAFAGGLPARQAEPPARRAPPARRWGLIGCGTILAVAVLAVLVAVFWRREGTVQVTGHSWKRSIAVERLTAVTESAWCTELPGDARSVRRSREVREERRVPDGENCQTRKVDRGDGTFVEREECTPRYRTEPVYADRCTFTVDRWRVARKAEASGDTRADPPRWADPAPRGGERVGAREETYTVKLRDAKGGEHDCELPEARWSALAPGAAIEAKIRVVTGAVDCSSLR